MTGEEFRSKIGYGKHCKIVVDRKTQSKSVIFSEIEEFNRIKKKLRVLARATSDDKLILIAGIKSPQQKSTGIVGMTGEGISDADAL